MGGPGPGFLNPGWHFKSIAFLIRSLIKILSFKALSAQVNVYGLGLGVLV